jgi:hypothetical protein
MWSSSRHSLLSKYKFEAFALNVFSQDMTSMCLLTWKVGGVQQELWRIRVQVLSWNPIPRRQTHVGCGVLPAGTTEQDAKTVCSEEQSRVVDGGEMRKEYSRLANIEAMKG